MRMLSYAPLRFGIRPDWTVGGDAVVMGGQMYAFMRLGVGGRG